LVFSEFPRLPVGSAIGASAISSAPSNPMPYASSVLSGFADFEGIIAAINDAQIFR